MTYGIVIPNRYEDIIQPLLKSINKHIADPKPEILIIADGHSRDYGYRRIDYKEPEFIFAKSANLGIKGLGGKDIVLLNDDCRVIEDNFFQLLEHLAYGSPGIGILSPLIIGCVGNRLQRWHDRGKFWNDSVSYQDAIDREYLCFPCVYLRRAMLDDIGLLNEKIKQYGYDDEDLCIRAHKAGWRTTVTQLAKIQHGDGSQELSEGRGKSWSLSYVRRYSRYGGRRKL